jgi:hypothetical protein
MTTAWDHAKGLADRHTGGAGTFIRLQNDGDAVVGAFVGEPTARELHWLDGRAEECAGHGCVHCRNGARPSLRILLNFYVPAESAMKVIEGGMMFFGSVLNVREKYGLDKWLFEVKRVGRPKDPKTTYTILPERPIDDAVATCLRTTPRHDLVALAQRGRN